MRLAILSFCTVEELFQLSTCIFWTILSIFAGAQKLLCFEVDQQRFHFFENFRPQCSSQFSQICDLGGTKKRVWIPCRLSLERLKDKTAASYKLISKCIFEAVSFFQAYYNEPLYRNFGGGKFLKVYASSDHLGMNLSEATEPSPRQGFKFFSVSIYALIIAAAFIGNLLVCAAFFWNPILRRSPTNHFIFSLAISDLLTACITVPFDLEQVLTNQFWPHGEALCVLWTTSYLINVPSSIWNLLAVSVDRYKGLQDPLNRFRQTPFMTRKRAGLVILTLWIYSALFALIPVMGWKLIPRSVENNVCQFNITQAYSLLSSFLNFVLPTLFMCVLYWRIYKIASSVTRNNALNQADSFPMTSEYAEKRLKKRIKTTKNIVVVVCAFLLCWMPHTVISIVYAFLFNSCPECLSAIPSELFTLLLMLGYSSSAMNPYLYALRNKQFKNTLSFLVPALRNKFAQRPRTSSHFDKSSCGNPARTSLSRSQSERCTGV